jgi:gliding motility-associated-like protein
MNFQPLLKIFSLVLLLAVSVSAVAQNTPLLVNNGAMFYVNGNVGDSAIVYVDGTVVNNDSIMVNLGKFIIKGDFVNNAQSGGFDVFPTFIEANDGLFVVHGDWENNGVYNAGEGKVRFPTSGLIEGTQVTRFHDLELVGPIVRSIRDSIDPFTSGPTIDVEIDETGTLDLDSGEFATNYNILWVFNPSTGAIIREECDTCGFVSSLDDGNLARVVNQNANYWFPTGSSINASTDPNNFKRFRPAILTPSTSDLDTLHVRFVNQNATNFGLPVVQTDTTICYVNPWWYHRINKDNGAVPEVGITIRSNPFEGDPDYNEMANWTASTSQWEGMPNTSYGVVNFLPQVVAADYDDYQTFPEDGYALAYSVPEPPNVQGDTALCASIAETYSVPQNGSDYDFVVTGGTVIAQDDYSVTVIWNNDSLGAVFGTVEVLETVPNNINGGCTSRLETYVVEVWPLPVADFTVVTDPTLPGGIFVYDILEMADSSLLTAEWNWDFGDGTTSTDSLPFHTYNEVGEYDITLIVRSGLECLDTLVVPVSVVEGLIVPNVFTPNNDGWNDVFDVRTSNVGPFKIEIYNRWGNVVFETTSPQISWDGTTAAGTAAAAGTYYYVISKADLNSGNAINNELDNFNFQETGWVQLLR